MDGINVLLEYLLIFKEIEKRQENSKVLKEIDKYILLLQNAEERTDKIKYIVDFDDFKKIVEIYDINDIKNELEIKVKNTYGLNTLEDVKSNEQVPSYLKEMLNSVSKSRDNVMVDIMLNLNRYNIYFMNKKTKSHMISTQADIRFYEIDVGLQEILNYLDVDKETIDKNILSDLDKFIKKDKENNLNKLKEFAIEMKTGAGLVKSLFDRIYDKNILLSILLHSDIKMVKELEMMLINKGLKTLDINKIVECIPSIFIKNTVNSKCKFMSLTHYDNFINNINLIEKYGVDIKSILNKPVFLVNDYEKNLESIKHLEGMGVNVKNVLEYAGNILAIKPSIVFNNINILSLYGIKLTNDDNNNGYTLLGMEDLSNRLDYFIESNEWNQKNDKLLDNIDWIRGLIIRDDYLKWKNNYKYVILNSTSPKEEFSNDDYSEDKWLKVSENSNVKSLVETLDNTFWDRDDIYYAIGFERVSRPRILRNLCNYKGKDEELLEKVIKHKSNINNSEEVINAIKNHLEMGDEGAKLSKGL